LIVLFTFRQEKQKEKEKEEERRRRKEEGKTTAPALVLLSSAVNFSPVRGRDGGWEKKKKRGEGKSEVRGVSFSFVYLSSNREGKGEEKGNAALEFAGRRFAVFIGGGGGRGEKGGGGEKEGEKRGGGSAALRKGSL